MRSVREAMRRVHVGGRQDGGHGYFGARNRNGFGRSCPEISNLPAPAHKEIFGKRRRLALVKIVSVTAGKLGGIRCRQGTKFFFTITI